MLECLVAIAKDPRYKTKDRLECEAICIDANMSNRVEPTDSVQPQRVEVETKVRLLGEVEATCIADANKSTSVQSSS